MQKVIVKTSLFLFFLMIFVSPCFADTSMLSVPLKQSAGVSVQKIDLSRQSGGSGSVTSVNLDENDAFYHLVNASDRFVQCNIKASWGDFKNLILSVGQNDFVYLSIAQRMSELGFFDLADLAISKVVDRQIARVSVDEMKSFYYPKKKLKLDDEMFLAEIYSNIMYNDQSGESANELLQNQNLMSTSDYANYLEALASYKSKEYAKAFRYVSFAIIQNPYNLNYLKLKAQILADGQTPTDAVKVVNVLKRQNLASAEYNRQVKSLEQYVLYKIAKCPWEKTYHLGYHYYLENDGSKAIRTLQGAIALSGRKSHQAKVYGLMSEIYLTLNEYEKASDCALRSHKIDSNNVQALMTLGNLSYKGGNYEQALKYYKKASGEDKYAYKPLVGMAKTYQKLKFEDKSREIYTKILKTHSDCYEAYYNVALMNSNNSEDELIYLKKAVSINLQYEDAWIELARLQIEREKYQIAQEYLSNAYYIDENDFRYYYYQGKLYKNIGETTKADYNFKKCLKLNPNFNAAQKELSPTIN